MFDQKLNFSNLMFRQTIGIIHLFCLRTDDLSTALQLYLTQFEEKCTNEVHYRKQIFDMFYLSKLNFRFFFLSKYTILKKTNF